MPKLSKNAIREKHDQTFVDVLAATNSPSKAIIAVEPELAAKPAYAAVKANRMLKRPDIKEKIDKKLQNMANPALKAINDLLKSDNEQIRTANAWKVIEHNIGTPVKRNINVNAQATIEDALFQ